MTLADWRAAAPYRRARRGALFAPGLRLAALTSLRGAARRLGPRLRVALVLALIAALTAAAAWLCWQAMVDERLSVGAARPAGSNGTLETSLVAAPPRPDAHVLTRKSASPPQEASTVRPPRTSAGGRQSGLAVGGPVLAAGGAGGVVALGAAASYLVLRRLRRPLDDDVTGDMTGVEASVRDETELHDLARDVDAPAAADPEQSDPEQSDPEQTDPEQAAPGQTGPEVDIDEAGPAAEGSRTSTAGIAAPPSEAPVPLALGGLDAWLAPGEQVEGDLAASAHRVYERRNAQRVDFEQDAVVVLGAQQWPVRTLDLSESGLRCRAAESDGSGMPPLPKPRARVVVHLRLGEQAVALCAEVVWRRSGRQGQEVGLSFAGLSEADLAAVRTVCAPR